MFYIYDDNSIINVMYLNIVAMPLQMYYIKHEYVMYCIGNQYNKVTGFMFVCLSLPKDLATR